MFKIILLISIIPIYANWSFINPSNAPVSNYIHDIQKDSSGYMYVGTYKFKNEQWIPIQYNGKDSIPSGHVLVEKDGAIWIGTQRSGLYKIEETGDAHFDSTNSCLDGLMVKPLGFDAEGALIVSTGDWQGMGCVFLKSYAIQ